MLVVTSNWCVPDGTICVGPSSGLVDRFRAEVRRSSLRRGFRSDGMYRPVDAVDVVLAGDTFDWLTSREWIGEVRPWDPGRRADAARERVATGSLRHAARLLATLAAWTRRGIEVPEADGRGRPVLSSQRHVPVRVTVLCGDRDRWLEDVAGSRAAVARVAAIGTCWSDGGVTVRHGEDLDPLWTAGGREPTLGESLAVDLFTRFGGTLGAVATLRPLAALLLRRLTGGRFIDAPLRLAGWFTECDRNATLPGKTRQDLLDAWNRSVACWHLAARRLSLCGDDGVDLVAALATALEINAAVACAGEWGPSSGTWPEALDSALCQVAGSIPPAAAADETVSARGIAETAVVVLGHPAMESVPSMSGRSQVVCLGPQAFQRGHDSRRWPAATMRSGGIGQWSPAGGDTAATPMAVVICPEDFSMGSDSGTGRESRTEWLSMGNASRGRNGHLRDGAVHGVWWSDAVRAGQLVIDAA